MCNSTSRRHHSHYNNYVNKLKWGRLGWHFSGSVGQQAAVRTQGKLIFLEQPKLPTSWLELLIKLMFNIMNNKRILFHIRTLEFAIK